MGHYDYSDSIKPLGAIPRLKHWFTINEAANKFRLTTTQLERWVDNRSVRSELDSNNNVLLKVVDIEQILNLTSFY